MIGSLIIRGLVLVFGYALPAYECYKTVDKNKTDVEKLRFWCQYWVLVAMLTVFERVGDALISWVPMYGEAKLFFYIYLWYPRTKGTTYVYNSFFRPYVSKHETDIDRKLLELRTRTGDYAVLFWQKATSYALTRILDIAQFISQKSTPKPPTTQPKRSPRVDQSATTRILKAASTAQPQMEAASKTQPETEETNSPSRTSSLESREVLVRTKSPSVVPTAALAAAVLNATKSTEQQPVAVPLKATASAEEALSAETVSSTSKDVVNPCQKIQS